MYEIGKVGNEVVAYKLDENNKYTHPIVRCEIKLNYDYEIVGHFSVSYNIEDLNETIYENKDFDLIRKMYYEIIRTLSENNKDLIYYDYYMVLGYKNFKLMYTKKTNDIYIPEHMIIPIED